MIMQMHLMSTLVNIPTLWFPKYCARREGKVLMMERCCSCDEYTGRAGKGEDSLYCDEHDSGPYCEDCWETHDEVIHKQNSPDYCMGNWG